MARITGFLLLLVVALAGSRALAANGIPHIDAQATCRAAAEADRATAQQINDSCVRSELEARDLLSKNWDSFRAADRSYCGRLATMGGIGSYVHMLTCLEMERDVRALREKEASSPSTTGSVR